MAPRTVFEGKCSIVSGDEIRIRPGETVGSEPGLWVEFKPRDKDSPGFIDGIFGLSLDRETVLRMARAMSTSHYWIGLSQPGTDLMVHVNIGSRTGRAAVRMTGWAE